MRGLNFGLGKHMKALLFLYNLALLDNIQKKN